MVVGPSNVISPFRRGTVARAALNALWSLPPPNYRLDLEVGSANGQAVAFKEGVLLISEEVELAALAGLIRGQWGQVLAYKHLSGKHDQLRHGHGGGATQFPSLQGGSLNQQKRIESVLSQMPQSIVDGTFSISLESRMRVGQAGMAQGHYIDVLSKLQGKNLEITVAHEVVHASMGGPVKLKNPDGTWRSSEFPRGLQSKGVSLYSRHTQGSKIPSGDPLRTHEEVHKVWASKRGNKPVTSYAMTNKNEYFAESISHYIITPAALKTRDPEMYDLIKEEFGD